MQATPMASDVCYSAGYMRLGRVMLRFVTFKEEIKDAKIEFHIRKKGI
jgi:hypothetical protein